MNGIWMCACLVFSMIGLTLNQSLTSCPTGFMYYNNYCVQLATSCPVNFVLQNGLCAPINGLIIPNYNCTNIVVTISCNQQGCPIPSSNGPPSNCPNQPIPALQPTIVQPGSSCPNQPVAPEIYPPPQTTSAPSINEGDGSKPTNGTACPNQPVPPLYYPGTTTAPPSSEQPAVSYTTTTAPSFTPPITECPQQPVPPITYPTATSGPIEPLRPTTTGNIASTAEPATTTEATATEATTTEASTTEASTATETTSHPAIVVGSTTTELDIESTTQVPSQIKPPQPAELIQCPPGTMLMGNVCRLIYCGTGIYANGRCVQAVCPAGTSWTGIKCGLNEPITHNIVLNETFTNVNVEPQQHLELSNVNNVIINASIVLPAGGQCASLERDTERCSNSAEVQETPPLQCCIVLSPRTCYRSTAADQWSCYSKRHHRCGTLCTTRTIILKPPNTEQAIDSAGKPVIVMSPEVTGNSSLDHRGTAAVDHDCSGCATGQMDYCSSYCYAYRCSSRSCAFYDQQAYCKLYAGGPGCRREDGCYAKWCNAGESFQ